MTSGRSPLSHPARSNLLAEGLPHSAHPAAAWRRAWQDVRRLTGRRGPPVRRASLMSLEGGHRDDPASYRLPVGNLLNRLIGVALFVPSHQLLLQRCNRRFDVLELS